ncbi:MAG: transporter substrate-binding domain-containing protein [Sneathiella sp.]|nr:transporter substrate-binding domain-containing protein [Sneathiella sp.]
MKSGIWRPMSGVGLLFCLTFTFLGHTNVANAKEDLRFCLEEGSPPYSYKFGKRTGGFDLLLAEQLAEKLNRNLKIQWYESEEDDEAIPIFEINALLSADFCDFVGGMALVASNLRSPVQPIAALPDYDGMKRSDRGKRVNLGELTATVPFIRAGLTIILSPEYATKKVERLSDLNGLVVGAEVTTLSSALLMRYQGGLLASKSKHFKPGKIFEELDAGTVDAALVERHRFDRYQKRHSETKLVATNYSHSIAYNISFAALKGSKAPIDQINTAINELIDTGKMQEIAAQEKLSYVAPRKPLVFYQVTPGMLLKD